MYSSPITIFLRMNMKQTLQRGLFSLALALGVSIASPVYAKDFLNVSYDPTRELYSEINKSFAIYWKNQTGQDINFKQSHGGSGKQSRAVVDGLNADVVTLALAYDIDNLEKSGLLAQDWQKKFPHNSTPYTSTVVFLVRKGNPKQIKDWNDLVRDGVEIITPNPKTSGLARWSYLGAWGYALKQPNGSDDTAKDFVAKVLKNVKVMDSGARGATTTFIERKMGDVLLAWENEALMTINSLKNKEEYEIVYPSISILAEPSVAIVDKNAQKNGNQWLALGYINFLYSPYGQDVVSRHYYRPRNEQVLTKYQTQFPKVNTFTIDDTFGGWQKAQQVHFNNGGTFDQIYQNMK